MLHTRDGVREVEAQLTGYLEKLSRRISVEAAVVTGSRARNTHFRTSDIDLVVLSDDFHGVSRLDRIGVLLEDWYDSPALEPMGFTADEALHADGLYLWDALADGRALIDNGGWARAQEGFKERWRGGELERTERGWKIHRSPRPAESTLPNRPHRRRSADFNR